MSVYQGPYESGTKAAPFHLGTLTRNDIRYSTDKNLPVVPTLALPTSAQRRAFELLDLPIPLTLK